MCYWRNSLPEVNVEKSIWSWTKCVNWKKSLQGWWERCEAAVGYCCLTRGGVEQAGRESAWEVAEVLGRYVLLFGALALLRLTGRTGLLADGWGRSRLIFSFCICSWFTHYFSSPSFPLPTCGFCSDPESMALEQLIKDLGRTAPLTKARLGCIWCKIKLSANLPRFALSSVHENSAEVQGCVTGLQKCHPKYMTFGS